MKLVSVIHGNVFGGAHNQALRLAPYLSDLGFETAVILPEGAGDAAGKLSDAGIDVYRLPLARLRATTNVATQGQMFRTSFGQLQRLERTLIRTRADLVQVHGVTNFDGAIAARRLGLPVVWQLLDTRAPRQLRRLLRPFVTRYADVIMSTGVTVARMHGISPGNPRLHPFFPPVDVRAFSEITAQSRSATRGLLGVTADEFVVGSVANFNPQKGHEYLIRAVALANADLPRPIVLRIRGSRSPAHPEYLDALRRLAAAAGLGDSVLNPPECGIPELMSAFDVVALTPVRRSEGVPTVLLEAAAAGKATLTTDVGGVREVIRPEGTGLIVGPEAVSDIASALVRLSDRLFRAYLGGEASAGAGQFDVARCAQTHARAYGAALQSWRVL